MRGHRRDRRRRGRRASPSGPNGTTGAAASSAATTSALAAAICSAVGGSSCRCRSVRRTQPTSIDTAATGDVRAEHELGRPAAEVDDEERPGVPRRRARPSRRGTTAAPPPRRRSTSGSTPERRAHAVDEVVPVLARPATRTSRRTGSARRPGSLHIAAYRRPRRACARAPPGRSGPSGRRPGRAGRPPSAGSRSVERARRGVDVRDEQTDGVGPAVDRSHTSHAAQPAIAATPPAPDPRPARAAGVRRARQQVQRSGRHGSRDQRERLVAERVDARPGGERVRDQHVQALDPVRHAAGRDARDLRDVAELGPARQVVLVRAPVRGRELGRPSASRAGHLPHHAGRPRACDAPRRPAGA